jgi:hypothetical protein
MNAEQEVVTSTSPFVRNRATRAVAHVSLLHWPQQSTSQQ